MIVKVSLPVLRLEGPAAYPVVYTRNLERARLQTIAPEVEAAVKAEARAAGTCAFFQAEWNERLDRWLIGKPVPWQEW